MQIVSCLGPFQPHANHGEADLQNFWRKPRYIGHRQKCSNLFPRHPVGRAPLDRQSCLVTCPIRPPLIIYSEHQLASLTFFRSQTITSAHRFFFPSQRTQHQPFEHSCHARTMVFVQFTQVPSCVEEVSMLQPGRKKLASAADSEHDGAHTGQLCSLVCLRLPKQTRNDIFITMQIQQTSPIHCDLLIP